MTSRPSLAPLVAAVLLSALAVAVAAPHLATLAYDPDEAWFILDARAIAHGLRPYADFPHHEMPFHLYLLAVAGKVFGTTLAGYRMLSLVSIAASGILLFCLARPLGWLPALVAEAVFLFTPAQVRSLGALPETATVAVTLLAAVLVFRGRGHASAYAGGVAFALAFFVKPTCVLVIAAAGASLAYAREWRRLRDVVVAGLAAGIVASAVVLVVSDGVFAEMIRFELLRLGTRSVGMWSIESAFTDWRHAHGIERPWQFAWSSFRVFFRYPSTSLAMALVAVSALGVPLWVARCARSRPALAAFAVLWPMSLAVTNFALLDFVSPRYFIPFVAVSAFLAAALVPSMRGRVPLAAATAAGVIGCAVLVRQLATTLADDEDPWYYARSNWIAHEYPAVVSFTPMLFASTGAEPGCGFANPALTYGGFGETVLRTERTARFRFSDERLLACLRERPTMPVVVDWAFYFFTRPGSSLRAYLDGEGSAQRLFFSPDALEQWNRDRLAMSPFR